MEESSCRPNIFSYATKELSQDAMICWLIDWSGQENVQDEEERALRDCGRLFVQALLRKHDVNLGPNEEINKTEIYQQDHSIDVLARINSEKKEYILLVEDKTGTKDHSGQLQRYYDAVKEGLTSLSKVDDRNLYALYLKTGNQPKCKDTEIETKSCYKVFHRHEFLSSVLNKYRGSNPILTDFRDYLGQKEDDTNSFKNWQKEKIGCWSWASWEGFFQCLEEKLGHGDWGYVPNPAGGFLGFYWHWLANCNLQLEIHPGNKEKQFLCFKVYAGKSDERNDLKWKWHQKICETGGESVQRPNVMRAGSFMTVAQWKGDWLAFHGDGRFHIEKTVENLKAAEKVLERATN